MATKSIASLFPSFIPGLRLVDGGELAQLVNLEFSVSTKIAAAVAGTQAAASPAPSALNQVETSTGTNTDSIVLNPAVPGASQVVYNKTANTITVFGQATNVNTGIGDTIIPNTSNTPALTATGITLATAKIAFFFCFDAGVWKELLTG